MNQKLITLDFWQDTVIYEGNTLPTGRIACETLNVSADTIAKMNEQCRIINLLLGLMNAGQNASSVIQVAREAAMKMLDILSVTPPFSYMNITRHRKRIEMVFTTESYVRYANCVKQANENLLQLTDVPDYARWQCLILSIKTLPCWTGTDCDNFQFVELKNSPSERRIRYD